MFVCFNIIFLIIEETRQLLKIQKEQELEAQAEREEMMRHQQQQILLQQQQQQAAMAWAHDVSRAGSKMMTSLVQIQQEETRTQMVQ